MDLSKYRQLYVSETQENLEGIASRVMELEANPENADHIDAIFRMFHSIKGMSGTMGYTPLMDLAHDLEELMERVRAGRLALNPEVCDLLLGGVDRMTQWVAHVDAERAIQAAEASGLRARIEGLLGVKTPVPATTAGIPGELSTSEGELIVRVRIKPGQRNAGLRGVLLVRKLGWIGRVSATAPAVETLRLGQLVVPLEIALHTPLDAERVERFVQLLPEWQEVSVKRSNPPPVTADDLLFTGDLGMTPVPDIVAGGPPPAPRKQPSIRTSAVVRGPTAGRTIRVRTEWLDGLLDEIAQVRIVSQRLAALEAAQPRPEGESVVGELSERLDALLDRALSVRMMPISILTDHLRRAVRDLSRQAGKRAVLTVEGSDERLDRAIIEGLDAPLTHLVRNAIDHGFETPQARAAIGKDPQGTLRLTCARQRDEIVITVQDDGAGIDRARLVERAVERGGISREQAQALAVDHLDRLVCMPGLSVREAVDMRAGRGVGMDVVRSAIVALGGSIEIFSEAGQGTAIHMHLPRTPGVVKVLQVKVDGQAFGLPAARVTEVGEEAGDEPHDLRDLLGAKRDRQPSVTVGLTAAGRKFNVLVDSVVGEREAIMKPMGPLLERMPGLAGVSLDAQGVPLLVLDVARIGAPE